MKFLDKVKNMFTEEVVEEEKIQDEVKVEQIIPEKKQATKTLEEFNQIKQTELKKEEKRPVFFTDDDFNDLDNYFKKEELPKRSIETRTEENIKKPEVVDVKERETKELYAGKYDPTKSANDYLEKYNEENMKAKEPYQGNTSQEKKAPKFRPTPIISPVYGVLDKNYHKEDIVNKNETKPKKAIDGLSVDTIREKAYGTLEDELENTLFGSNSILFNEKDKKKKEHDFFDDLELEDNNEKDHDLRDLENITMDIGKELDTLLNKEEKQKNDLEVSDITSEENKKVNFDDEDDLFNLIDSMYSGDDDYDN